METYVITVLAFVTNENMNPFEGPVGLSYHFYRHIGFNPTRIGFDNLVTNLRTVWTNVWTFDALDSIGPHETNSDFAFRYAPFITSVIVLAIHSIFCACQRFYAEKSTQRMFDELTGVYDEKRTLVGAFDERQKIGDVECYYDVDCYYYAT